MPWPDDVANVTVEVEGKQVPLKDHQLVKDSPDIGHFARRAFDMHTEMGRRIPINVKNDDEKVAWRKEHLPKLHAAGIIEAPPAKPEDYGITRPATLAKDVPWSDTLAKELATTLHELGIPKSAVPKLMALHERAVSGAMPVLKTNYDTAMAKLKEEHKDKFDERFELAGRLANTILSEDDKQFIDDTGLADHPRFLSILMKLAPLAQSDSSFIAEMNRGGGSGEMTGDQVREWVAKMSSDKTDPNYTRYWAQDPALMKEIDDKYKSAYGTGTVTI